MAGGTSSATASLWVVGGPPHSEERKKGAATLHHSGRIKLINARTSACCCLPAWSGWCSRGQTGSRTGSLYRARCEASSGPIGGSIGSRPRRLWWISWRLRRGNRRPRPRRPSPSLSTRSAVNRRECLATSMFGQAATTKAPHIKTSPPPQTTKCQTSSFGLTCATRKSAYRAKWVNWTELTSGRV